MRLTRATALLAVAALLVVPVATSALAGPRDDADYTEYYFPSGDGVTNLHADVLRPKGLNEDVRTPVILTVSPYFNHAGSTTEYQNNEGPNERFYDFLDLSKILERGYTYVMVDLPGTGGSGGCNDWGGPVEQGAVKTAVEWAASQSWSTGKVGLIGKSYDAWTGLMGMAQNPKGLKAVVSMEPVYAGYRYLYNNGVRFVNSAATPATFQAVDAKPGSPQDDPQYQANGAPMAYCYGTNYGLQQQDDDQTAFWKERDLLELAKGSKIPLFLTQGFLETNTKPDGAFDFWNNVKGPNRAWFGQFDHVRGWERQGGGYLEGRFETGREVFVEEVMRFFDRYVKGLSLKKAPVHRDAKVAVQDNLGRYRAEASWPPKDSKMWWNKVNVGTYEDDRGNTSTGGVGIWTFSQKIKKPVWMSGEPVIEVEVDSAPRANFVANIYDLAPDGRATMVSRGTWLLRDQGVQTVKFDLYGQDWLIAKGHRIGVLISGSNTDWWVHAPTNSTVTVNAAKIGLPLLTYKRTKFLDGTSTARLETYKGSMVATVDKETVTAGAKKFKLPKRLKKRR